MHRPLRWLPLVALLAAGPALAQDTRSRISVVGEGTASARPDVMIVDVGVQVLRPTSREALSAAADRAQALVKALKKAGVKEEDLQTRTLQIHPRYDYDERERRLVGYEASNVVTATVRDLDRAGKVVDAAVEAAGDEAILQGVRFDIEDDDALLEAARREAWQDAERTAKQLAQLAEVELGAPLTIVEQGGVPQPIPYARAEMAADVATPIEPGQVDVRVTLQVDFDLNP